ncbi:hypothetical protein [Bifidobacterium oedipodis]|uniref:hypothetical protein n=1 Tax=Bifidobacterium oedipodis TaxID=2675322 RepID=UPI00145F5A04|nr:hypothetical protein [Bifidobacterium sp. DSM 109957]
MYDAGNISTGQSRGGVISFSQNFSRTPAVSAGSSQAGVIFNITDLSSQSFSYALYSVSANAHVSIHWSAVGV